MAKRYRTSTGQIVSGEDPSIDDFIAGGATEIVDPATPEPTVGEAFSGIVGESPEERSARENRAGILETSANQPIDEGAIRQRTTESFQAEIDALEKIFNEKKRVEGIAGEGRLGETGAIQARRGLLGSDFGATQTEATRGFNVSKQDAITANKTLALENIYKQIRTSVDREIEAKKKAKEAGSSNYLAFIRDTDTRKKGYVSATIKNFIVSGNTPTDEDYNNIAGQLGVNVDDVKSAYKEQFDAQEVAKQTQEALTEKEALETRKTEAGISKTEAETLKLRAEEARKTATTSRMINGEEHTILYDTQTGEDINDLGVSKVSENTNWEKIGVDEDGEDVFGFVDEATKEVTQFVDKTGMRTDRHNNPIAVAMPTGGTNEFTDALDNAGIEWSEGDPFANNASMATINILGNPAEASRVILSDTGAIQNWYANHTGKTVLSQTGITNNEEFANAPLEVQNKIIEGIYRSEGGNGSLLEQQGVIEEEDQLSQFTPEAIDLAKSVAEGDAKWSDITGADNAQLKIEAIRVAKLLPPPEKEIKAAKERVKDLKDLLMHTGLNSSVGPKAFLRTAIADQFGNKQDFLGKANKLVSQEALQSLIDAKSQGATFGALSDREMDLLKAAATTLGTWETGGTFGIGTDEGYNISEKKFKEEIQRMIDGYEEILKEASGEGDTIRVKIKETGVTGTIPANEFDDNIYDKI